jgi:hypothetical protein
MRFNAPASLNTQPSVEPGRQGDASGIHASRQSDQKRTEGWLPFLNIYRTMCLAPEPDFQRVLEEIRDMRLAA